MSNLATRSFKWAALSLCLWAATAQAQAPAQVYKWIDDKGVVHFGDQKPDKGARKFEEVKVPDMNVVASEKVQPKPAGDSRAGTDGNPPAAGPNSPSGPVGQSDPAAPPAATPNRGVASSRASCETKKAEYEASQMCFSTCGKFAVGGGRNNQGCEQCAEMAQPNC